MRFSLSVCACPPRSALSLALLWVLASLPQFLLMGSHVWECWVHLSPGVGPLPELKYDMLKIPVQVTSYPEQLVFRGPLDGSGGAKFVLSAAKLAIESYIKHGCLEGRHQVSQPMVYKMVYDSEMAWDEVDDVTPADLKVVVKKSRRKVSQNHHHRKSRRMPSQNHHHYKSTSLD